MTRAEVLAYAATLEFIPLCLHWGTCQACGVVVWWADTEGNRSIPMAFARHHCDVGPKVGGQMTGVVVSCGEYLFTDAEREGKSTCAPTPHLVSTFGDGWTLGVSGVTCRVGDMTKQMATALGWTGGPSHPYDPAALSEAIRRDRDP
jgi:hypothetical protein